MTMIKGLHLQNFFKLVWILALLPGIHAAPCTNSPYHNCVVRLSSAAAFGISLGIFILVVIIMVGITMVRRRRAQQANLAFIRNVQGQHGGYNQNYPSNFPPGYTPHYAAPIPQGYPPPPGPPPGLYTKDNNGPQASYNAPNVPQFPMPTHHNVQ